MSDYDFDTVIDRSGTGSLKWNRYGDRDVLPLWVADMDFAGAPEILHALRERVGHGIMGYTKPWPAVTECVQAYLEREHGLIADARHLVFTPGMVSVLNLACLAFAGPGEEVMTCTPVYPPFLSAPRLRGRSLVDVPLCLDDEDRWTFDFDAMEEAVTENTRLFILCNPHNPTGRCYGEPELRRLAEFVERHDLILISDEIHCDLVLEEDVSHLCMAAHFPEIADRIVTLMSPSKTYNLPGLCCAYTHVPGTDARNAMARATAGIFTEINCFGYAGLMAAYGHGEPWRRELLAYLRGNRDLAYERLAAECPEIGLRPMEATYLAWLDVRGLNLEKPVDHFEAHGVGLSDGADFHGDGHLRLNFGCPRSVLEQGLDRIAAAAGKR